LVPSSPKAVQRGAMIRARRVFRQPIGLSKPGSPFFAGGGTCPDFIGTPPFGEVNLPLEDQIDRLLKILASFTLTCILIHRQWNAQRLLLRVAVKGQVVHSLERRSQ
jgi:hypothetical protein